MVYFLQLDNGAIKIGFTDCLESRLQSLESHNGKPVSLLKTMPGDRSVERSLHERFSHLRMGRTEQFRPEGDLMEFIGKPLLVGANPDAVEALPPHKNSRYSPAKIDSRVLAKAKKAAALKEITLAEFLSQAVEEVADRELAIEGAKFAPPLKQPPPRR